MTKKQKLLSDSIEELKVEILYSSLGEIAEKYDVSRDFLAYFIKDTPELYKVYVSTERKEILYETRRKKKKQVDKQSDVQLFQKRLNESAVVRLAESVIRLAVKEKDVYFFISGRYEFWEQFTTNRKSAEHYLNCIKALP